MTDTTLLSRLRHLLARRAAMLAIAQRARAAGWVHSDLEYEARRAVDRLGSEVDRVKAEMERRRE